MNDWNFDASCTLTSLQLWHLENFKRLIFVVQSVHGTQYFIQHNKACHKKSMYKIQKKKQKKNKAH
jgi:hypothetical protein